MILGADMARAQEKATLEFSLDLTRYIPALKAYIARNGVNPAQVDDLVQDVMLRLHARRQGGAIENIEGYLFRAASNAITDNARRDKVRHVRAHQELTEIEHPVEECSPERVLMGKEDVACAAAALQELPERTRDAFLMQRFEELPYGEIARRMGISVSAVEKHVAKALLHIALRLRG